MQVSDMQRAAVQPLLAAVRERIAPLEAAQPSLAAAAAADDGNVRGKLLCFTLFDCSFIKFRHECEVSCCQKWPPCVRQSLGSHSVSWGSAGSTSAGSRSVVAL